MKKILLVIVITILSNATLSACEICGCGVGNFYMGILPGFQSKFIGMRYSYQHYQSVMAKDASQFSNDFYKTTELWAGWNMGTHWQVLAFVPYTSNRKISDDGVKTTVGLGDISLMANYQLLGTRRNNQSNKTIGHQLSVGAGVKLASGNYHLDFTDPAINIGDANSQTGTGSTDILLNARYVYSIQQLGTQTTLTYKINTTNKDQYRFGNRLAINSFAYYRIRFAGMAISPNLGLLYEHSDANFFENSLVDQTGGWLFNGVAGVEMNFNKISIGINAQLPINQQFAEGQTLSKNRGVAHISFAF